MQAGVYDIQVEQGADWSISLIWKDDTGTPVNLTGYTARLQIRKAFKETSTKLDLTSAAGAIVLGGSAGTVMVNATAAQTSGISLDYQLLFWKDGKQTQSMVYDLILTDSSSRVTRLLQGAAFIYPEVTR